MKYPGRSLFNNSWSPYPAPAGTRTAGILSAGSSHERGGAFLYLLIALPFSLSFLFLAIDFVRWQTLKQQLQVETDNLALNAARALPDLARASHIVHTRIAANSSLAIKHKPVLSLSSSSLSLSLGGQIDSVFHSFFPAKPLFSAWQEASVSLVPVDSVLIISDSTTLKPQPYTHWGDAVSWPSAGYFDRVSLPCNSDFHPTIATICKKNQQDLFSNWATQNCFNPVFSPLKEAAIEISDLLLSSPENRLGLMFSPGDNIQQGFSMARALSSQKDATNKWAYFVDKEHQLSDESCLYFANPEISLPGRYTIPKLSPVLAQQNNLTNPPIFLTADPLQPPLHLAANRLNPQYLDKALSARELIYYRMARSVTNAAKAINILKAIQGSSCELNPGCKLSNFSSDQATSELRKNKALVSKRQILLITDSLPPAETLPEIAKTERALAAAEAELIILAFRHPRLDQISRSSLTSAAENFAKVKNTSIFLADSTHDLKRIISENIIPSFREYSLDS